MVTDDSLHGCTVLSADGHALGEIAHLLVDPAKLELVALEVKLRNDVADRLQVPHGLLRSAVLRISLEQVGSVGDAVILTVPLDALAAGAGSHVEQPPTAH